MSILSKEVFDRVVVGRTCHDFIHPWSPTCPGGFIGMAISSIKGSAKFSLVLFAVFGKGRNITRTHFITFFQHFIRLISFGTSLSLIFLTSICIQRNLLGRFIYHTSMSISGFLAGASIFILHSSRRHLVIPAFSSATLETFLHYHIGLKNRSWRKSETLFFMIVNSAFLYYIKLWKTMKKDQTLPELWFYSPDYTKSPPNCNEKPNSVDRPYDDVNFNLKKILKESSNYFWFGTAVEVLRITLTNINTIIKDPKQIYNLIFKRTTLRLAIFAGLYVFLFKITNCILCRISGKDKTTHAIGAGFISGLAYYINPNISLSLTAFTNLIHLIWRYYNLNSKICKDFPTSELLFMFFTGFLFHYRIFAPDSCSRFFVNLISLATSGRSEEMYKNFKKTCDTFVI